MSSRKEEKDRLREQREAAERQLEQRERRRRRLATLAGILLGAAALVAIAVAAGSAGSSKPSGLVSGSKSSATVSAVSSLLRGIPQSGTRLGRPTAPVTMDYYGDLQCPVCRDFTLTSLPQVIKNDVRAGKLQIRYRSLETATPDPATFQTQQVAALAAGRQNRLWQFVELFYRQQGQEGTGYVTAAYLNGLARQVPGLNMTAWRSARAESALGAQVRTDAAAASVAGATATPTLVIHGPKGTKAASGVVSASGISQMVAAVSS
jgi:protein-disulfide isomerase